MAKMKIRGKDLIKLGYPEGKVVGLAINSLYEHHRRQSREWGLAMLKNILEHPRNFVEDEAFGRVARELIGAEQDQRKEGYYELLEQVKPFPIFGEEQIEEGAKHQMFTAMRLPVAVDGALMPDAHQGYGLPIGGVLAVDNAVIPYGVGVDIGCRMCLTMYNLSPSHLREQPEKFEKLLLENSRFGLDTFDDPMDDPVLERKEFKYIKVVKDLKHRAYQQIGSSGGGNHFVEFGTVRLSDPKNDFDLPVGDYLAVLSHSGSRGLGANIARHYTKVAMDKCRLPKVARHLAWLTLDSQEGHEYWMAMNLAGDYASACHDHIHRRIARALGEAPIARVENHHNFAWKEQLADGRQVVVHRKGATPAGKGVLGIIPGSMTAPGFIVRGKGHNDSVNSASHGAGRVMSRSKAKSLISTGDFRDHLAEQGVRLIGGGLDEAPMAYKDIHEVMRSQQDLVDIVGIFQPRVVRMEGAKARNWK
ncbi:RtcB family protein [Flavilitoribacter nigricans]|uniref:3'-phosphate/5'-hydroxy nucleic acid ligase n=1 Tax=Flavilitoribacter nigricans (strain ATCC 23147 / DSM 23189 / NBRC 102662 / NCIMB 1420 / SS-2) TaxID=1122177 RepID=A0A2D0N691_FLAN2|nr:RtcB family protein [Flavilitoribacter nigricans]PHN03908.1 RNA-splicing ligase RtcB [Flavilitoribacter nigricans DSM 23189 = NBRC 102662]